MCQENFILSCGLDVDVGVDVRHVRLGPMTRAKGEGEDGVNEDGMGEGGKKLGGSVKLRLYLSVVRCGAQTSSWRWRASRFTRIDRLLLASFVVAILHLSWTRVVC